MSWDEWSKRSMKRFPFGFPFSSTPIDIDDLGEEMKKDMEEMLTRFEDHIPRRMIRKRRLTDGTPSKSMGPFIYGFSMALGPERKPIIKEFGNSRPSRLTLPSEPPFDVEEGREPLVEVVEGDTDVRIVAELPGVEKEDIKLYSTESTLTISVDTSDKRYDKELDLPVQVEPTNAKSTYRNGVLQVILPKRERKPKGESVKD